MDSSLPGCLVSAIISENYIKHGCFVSKRTRKDQGWSLDLVSSVVNPMMIHSLLGYGFQYPPNGSLNGEIGSFPHMIQSHKAPDILEPRRCVRVLFATGMLFGSLEVETSAAIMKRTHSI